MLADSSHSDSMATISTLCAVRMELEAGKAQVASAAVSQTLGLFFKLKLLFNINVVLTDFLATWGQQNKLNTILIQFNITTM